MNPRSPTSSVSPTSTATANETGFSRPTDEPTQPPLSQDSGGFLFGPIPMNPNDKTPDKNAHLIQSFLELVMDSAAG